MTTKVQQAVENFKAGFNCSQAIVITYCNQFGLDPKQGSKVATGFGGGMQMAETCGAVTGAFMILGLKHGNTTAGDQPAKKATYKLVKEFTKQFKARNNSVTCRELLKADISTPEGMKEIKTKNLFETHCQKMVHDAAEILEQMLED